MKQDITTCGKTGVLDFPIYDLELKHLDLNKKNVINTINQYSFVTTKRDEEFRQALMASDVLLPDGVGIVLASRFLTGKKIAKIAGADLHEYLLDDLNKKNGRCFYLGSSENTLSKIKNRLKKDYPFIEVKTYSPPFKAAFSDSDNNKMIDAVNSFNPDVLFIGMTAPKQEKWAFQHKEQLNAKTICSIGAVFDFYAGTVKRPNKFWINIGMEWFIRLINEPKRMWKRYLYYGPLFAYLLVNEKWQKNVLN